jgi:hypothetical protein
MTTDLDQARDERDRQCQDDSIWGSRDPPLKPIRLNISETVRWLGYKPAYSLANLLTELAAFGDSGPPHFYRELRNACAAAVALPVGEL